MTDRADDSGAPGAAESGRWNRPHRSAFPARDSDPGWCEDCAGPLAIEFDDVSFAYEELGVSMGSGSLSPPESPSACRPDRGGTTTLTRLIARLYDPSWRRTGRGHDLRASAQSHSVGRRRRHPGRTLFEELSGNLTLLSAPTKGSSPFWREWVSERGSDSSGRGRSLGAGGQGLSPRAATPRLRPVFLQDSGVVILDEPSSTSRPGDRDAPGHRHREALRGADRGDHRYRLETVRTADEY